MAILGQIPLCLSEAQSLTSYVDLTHPVGKGSIAWPTNAQFTVTKMFRDQIGGDHGFWYESRDFSQAEHSGTHLDAPAHFAKGKWRVDDIPLEKLIGPGVTVDISAKVDEEGPDTELSVSDLIHWEVEHGAIPVRGVVIVRTGQGRFYNNRTLYFGRPEGIQVPENDTEHLHFPGVGDDAARWLVKEREIVGLGIDTASTDRGQSRDFLTHRVLGEANVWGVENLARTEDLPPRGFQVHCMVHYLEGGSGGPARVVAILNSESAASRRGYTYTLVPSIVFTLYYLFCL